MARLLGTERNGHRVDRYWLHTGDDGTDRITVETVEDVEPVIRAVANAQRKRPGSDMHHVASIPATVVDEVCRLEAERRGCSRREVFAELVAGQTDEAKRIWRMLTEGRDYRKFQVQG